MKGIVFALGYPYEMMPDVELRCSAVLLSVRRNNVRYLIERNTETPFPITVTAAAGSTAPILLKNEKEASEWFLEFFGIPNRTLTTKNNAGAVPYLAAVTPVFWVDQDLGWGSTYAPLPEKAFYRTSEKRC